MFHKRIKMEYYDGYTLYIELEEVVVSFNHGVVQACLMNLIDLIDNLLYSMTISGFSFLDLTLPVYDLSGLEETDFFFLGTTSLI